MCRYNYKSELTTVKYSGAKSRSYGGERILIKTESSEKINTTGIKLPSLSKPKGVL